MREPEWADKTTLLLLQALAIAEHGGLEGVRDDGLLDSALARPRNLWAYEGITSLARLAASYAFAIVRNHPFADGNKRAAFMAATVFLARNEVRLRADQGETTRIFYGLASGEISEMCLAEWIEKHLT
jgi:death-on-curing protein